LSCEKCVLKEVQRERERERERVEARETVKKDPYLLISGYPDTRVSG